jgi:hypothetical protein
MAELSRQGREIKALWSALDKNFAELTERIRDAELCVDDDKLQNVLDYQSDDMPEEACGCEESVRLRAEVAMQDAEIAELRARIRLA